MITPSTDIFTMFVTALPLQLVYELSVFVARHADAKPGNSNEWLEPVSDEVYGKLK
jgi:Sec-independent protein secretion pathway component TatC